jgi:hypothetical protein
VASQPQLDRLKERQTCAFEITTSALLQESSCFALSCTRHELAISEPQQQEAASMLMLEDEWEQPPYYRAFQIPTDACNPYFGLLV